MTIRVLLMISSMQGGGSEQQTLLLLRHLDRSQFSPHLYLTSATGDLMSRIPDDVQVHSYPASDQEGKFYFPGRVLRDQIHHVRTLLEDQKIDVIYDRTFHMTMIAGPAAKSKRVPRVSTIVSPPDRALPMVEKRFVRMKRRRLAKAYRNSAKVVAVSKQASASAIAYYGFPESKLEVIPNPVDREQVLAAAGETIARPGIGLTLACVGRMTPEKGHADLIDALALTESDWKDDPIHVWLIGDGPLLEKLQHQANEKLTLHQVHFVGHQSNPAAWIASSDGLVLPSHFEGMPNVVLESMAIGRPVIATRSGGTVELSGQPPTMFMADPKNPPSLAKAIKQFCDQPEARTQLADAATERIRMNHDVGKTTGRIESLLKKSCLG